jgi:hypothetical protein
MDLRVMQGVSTAEMHGGAGDPTWAPPQLVTEYDVAARLSWTDVKAHEFVDQPDVMAAKVRTLAELIRRSKCCLAYTGSEI